MATDKSALDIRVDGEALEQVNRFTYLGAIITANGDCGADIKVRIGLSKLMPIWSGRAFTTSTKIRLLKALVWSVATYGAEGWTCRKEEWKRWLAFETIGYRRVLGISWTAKKTNEEVLQEVDGRQLPGLLVKRKLQFFGHIMRKEGVNMEKDIIIGTTRGNRSRGRLRHLWLNDITD